MQPALDCETCGALTSAAHFRSFGDRLICGACDHQNPQSRVRPVPRELLAPQTICLNFVPADGYTVQAMRLDHRTVLGPRVKVASAETLRRLLIYLRATSVQLAEFDDSYRQSGQGTTQITLAPGRKNLLRLRS